MERCYRQWFGWSNRGRWHGQAGAWGRDMLPPVSLQRRVLGWAEPDKGACAILQLGFWESISHSLAFLPVSAGAGPRHLTHAPALCPAPCSPPLTNPTEPERSGAATPGTARPCGSRRPPGPRRGLQRSHPPRSVPLPAGPGQTPPDPNPDPDPTPTPAPAPRAPRASRWRAGASRLLIGCPLWPIESCPGLRPAPPPEGSGVGSLGPAPPAV